MNFKSFNRGKITDLLGVLNVIPWPGSKLSRCWFAKFTENPENSLVFWCRFFPTWITCQNYQKSTFFWTQTLPIAVQLIINQYLYIFRLWKHVLTIKILYFCHYRSVLSNKRELVFQLFEYQNFYRYSWQMSVTTKDQGV